MVHGTWVPRVAVALRKTPPPKFFSIALARPAPVFSLPAPIVVPMPVRVVK